MGRLSRAAEESFQKASARQPIPDWFGKFALGVTGVLTLFILVGGIFGGGGDSPTVSTTVPVPVVVPSWDSTSTSTGGGSTVTTRPIGSPRDGPTRAVPGPDGATDVTIAEAAYQAAVAFVGASQPGARVNQVRVTEPGADVIRFLLTVDPDGLGPLPANLMFVTATQRAGLWTATAA